MSASIEQVQRPRQRNASAEKARRERLMLVGLVAILAVVLALTLPHTLKMLHSGGGGSSTPTAAAPAVTPTPAPAPAPAVQPQATRKPSAELQALLHGQGADPFRSRSGVSDSDRAPVNVAAPAGARDPFGSGRAFDHDAAPRSVAWPAGLRDPFVKPGTGAAAPTAPSPGVIVIGTRGHGAATIGYIVILASIPLAEGEGAAVLFARQARADGIGGVHILNSSSRKTLRHGYWAVYIGPYKTVSAAEHAASAVHTIVGYGGSYVRELIRFG